MTTRDLMIARLMTSVPVVGVALRSHENDQNAATVGNLEHQLQPTSAELASATAHVSEANKELGFLEAAKDRVQVTAYALTDDFGRFSRTIRPHEQHMPNAGALFFILLRQRSGASAHKGQSRPTG